MAGLSTNAPGLWGGFAGLLYGSTSLSTPPGFLADATPAWVPDGGVLAFEFDNGLGYNSRNLATTTPDSILTYTNPSPKLVYGSDGVLRYAPHNLLLQSNNFDTTWTNVNSSETLNATTDPDGGNDATKLHVDTTASSHTIRQNVTLRTGMTYTFSIRAKEGELGWLAFDDGLSCNAYFNLSTGERGSFSNCTSTIAPLGSGWHLITITFVAAGTGGVPKIYVAEANNDVTFAGANTTDGLFIYRAQLNLGSSALTYIPTTTAAVYSLPIDHNPTTFEPLGVLIEEQRTNLCLYSDDFTNAAWVKTNLTAAKTATGPDGVTNSASTLTATAANATARQDVTSASAARITSMFVKRRTGTGAVYLSQGGTTGSELVVNGTFTTNTTGWTASGATLAVVSSELEVTNTGASSGIADSDAFATVVGTAYLVGYTARRGTSSSIDIQVRKTAGGAETSVTLTNTSNVDGFLYFIASTTSTFIRVSSNQAVLGRTGYFDNLSVKAAVETTVTVTSDWTRVATASATVTNPPLIIRMATSGDAIDVALFDHELGAFITSPIPTVASQVTRLADQVSILTSAFAYSATAGTYAVEADGQFTAGTITTWFRDDNIVLTNTASGVRVYNSASSPLALLGSYTPGTMAKVAVGYMSGASASAGSIAGAAVVTFTNPGDTATTLLLGRGNTASGQFPLNGHIKRLTYFPTRRTDADLQVLTRGDDLVWGAGDYLVWGSGNNLTW